MSFLIVTTIKDTLHFKKGKIKKFDQYALEPVQFIEDTYITYIYLWQLLMQETVTKVQISIPISNETF